MIVNIYSIINEKGEFLVNKKGCDELDIDLNSVASFSLDSDLRLLGLGKSEMYRLTMKSWKALKKELFKRGFLNIGGRFNLSKNTI